MKRKWVSAIYSWLLVWSCEGRSHGSLACARCARSRSTIMTVTLSPLSERTAELASSVAARSAAPSRAAEHLPLRGSHSPPAPSPPRSCSSRASCGVQCSACEADARTHIISMKIHVKHNTMNSPINERTSRIFVTVSIAF